MGSPPTAWAYSSITKGWFRVTWSSSNYKLYQKGKFEADLQSREGVCLLNSNWELLPHPVQHNQAFFAALTKPQIPVRDDEHHHSDDHFSVTQAFCFRICARSQNKETFKHHFTKWMDWAQPTDELVPEIIKNISQIQHFRWKYEINAADNHEPAEFMNIKNAASGKIKIWPQCAQCSCLFLTYS